MTGRERVPAPLNRDSTDRVPFDIGGTGCSSIHSPAYKSFREHCELLVGTVKCGAVNDIILLLIEAGVDALNADDPAVVKAFQSECR